MNLLKLLTLLKVPNVPPSWYKLKQNIHRSETNVKSKQTMLDLTLYFCPECEKESRNSDKCSNVQCPNNKIRLVPPHVCLIMNIEQQIEQVT
jgi:hypothetical protein